jgi:hypothetical protein
MTITPGDLFVANSSLEASVEPRMPSSDIEKQALQDWIKASLSLF